MDTDRLVVWSRVSASWFVVIGCLLLLSLTVACGLENEGSDAGPQDETGGGQQPPVSVEDEVGSGEEQYDPEPDPAEGSGVTGNAEQTAESPGFGEITSVEDAQAATLRIETRGIVTSPEESQQQVVGSGSGFIIDPSGLAVTNNHVVTGAASIQVYFDDDTEARNARLLGISECSDLAVIDVAGDGYRYFDWYEGDPHPGLPVYAAGFPLGEPKFNLNQGIVSQENAASETVWASVDSAIEHDANINPGNSGGPLMDQNGRVVGVNYAKSSMTNQSLAISTREVHSVLDQLVANEDVDSIGVNGEARKADEDDTTGIYVHSVASGSPAERVGIRGGDFITQLEGIPLAEDETMSTCCDMLRSRTSQDVIKIQVLRQDTGELLEGQINGVPLQVVSGGETTVPEANEETTGPGETVGSGGYPDYTTLTDQSGALRVEIPAEWEDVSHVASELNEVPVAQLSAAPDLEDWQELKGPGMWFVAARELAQQFTVEELLDATDYSGNCEERTREEYYDGAYTGLSDAYAGCGPGAVDLQVVSAAPDDREFLVLVVVAQLDERDEEAWDRIRATFLVDRTELTR